MTTYKIVIGLFDNTIVDPCRDGYGSGRPAGRVGSGRGSDSRQICRVGSKFLKCVRLICQSN